MTRKARCDKFAQGFTAGRGISLEAHDRAHLLPPIVIGDPHHGNFSHGGMGVDHFFYLTWINILATTNDHVFQTAGNTAKTTRVHAA